jgi:tetratricopeptide (TPR) repeat protein
MKPLKALGAMSSAGPKLLAGIWIFCSLLWGQQPAVSWQDEVRRCAEAQDWAAAMRIVDREITRAPQDMDKRAWRARILAWSGQLAEAEHEYLEILSVTPNDPDNWLGLGNVYSREGKTDEALRALDRAVEIDPKRADLRAAHARALQAANNQSAAKLEFKTALDLDPRSTEAHTGLLSLRGEPKHELRVGVNTDLFNFADANHDQGVSLTSQWTPHWRTSVVGDFYQRAGTDAGKFVANVTGKLPRWGALTVGGATARDNDVIPKSEAFFDCDHGWRLGERGPVRGIEIAYGQHWYWYSTAQILAVSGTTLVYLPHEWTWSLGLTGARSQFAGAGAEWRPSGVTKLGFPITGRNQRRLGGNVFFAVGTENFAQVDQIGRFSSQTYGGGLRFQFTARQDVAAYAAYQNRTQDRTQTSFGFSYGVRF